MSLFSARNLFLGALFAATTSLTAFADSMQVKLVNAGSPTEIASSITVDGVTKKNVYIGPYTLSINGKDTAAMCIDFNIASYVGDSYMANVTTVGSSNLSNTYYPNDGQVYLEEAYLFSQIVKPNADREAIQIAAWNIMAYGITDTSYTTANKLHDSSYIDAALTNYNSMQGLYAVVSDTAKFGEQEFIVDPSGFAVTPEPSTLLLTLAPALLMGAGVVRRRVAAEASLG